jgi:hypothetical protein
MMKSRSQRFKVVKVEEVPEENEDVVVPPVEQPQKRSNASLNGTSKKPQFSNDKAKIADVFELPITVVNNVLYW